jgi:uncharacterized protein YjiS (DUF1127 family)
MAINNIFQMIRHLQRRIAAAQDSKLNDHILADIGIARGDIRMKPSASPRPALRPSNCATPPWPPRDRLGRSLMVHGVTPSGSQVLEKFAGLVVGIARRRSAVGHRHGTTSAQIWLADPEKQID